MTTASSVVEICPWCADPTPAVPGRYFCEPHVAEHEARARQAREREARENRGDWLDALGVPRGLQGISFSSVEETRCVQLVLEYRPRVVDGRALVLLGPTGVGKTVATVALLDSLLPDLQVRQRYELGPTLVRQFGDFSVRDQALKRCARVRLLVIDDLPSHRDDERAAALIEELLVVRESERRATLITSNVAPQRLETLLGDRVRDRLRSWGSVEAVAGPSLRRAPEVT